VVFSPSAALISLVALLEHTIKEIGDGVSPAGSGTAILALVVEPDPVVHPAATKATKAINAIAVRPLPRTSRVYQRQHEVPGQWAI